jgi:hypothetical protein
MIRSYTDLLRQGENFEARYEYLRLGGAVASDTFGFDRPFNQRFYRSREWRNVRDYVIARDYGCDLAMPGYEIFDNIHIHHMNPMSVEDIQNGSDSILDPEFLISVSQLTHNAIHYGSKATLRTVPEDRQPGDTKLW